jgi:hypothetical protein
MATGIMGWSTPGGQGLNFPCQIVLSGGTLQLLPRSDSPNFTDIDLYLMGLLPREQVGPHVVLLNLTAPPSCTGQTYTGATAPASLDDVVARFGSRVPAFPNAPTRFRIATIAVSREGLLDEDAMSLFAEFARRAQETRELAVHEGFSKYTGKPFAVATGGRGTLDARVNAPGAVADFDVSVAPAEITVARGVSATASVRVQAASGSFNDRVDLACSGLPARSSCSFSPADLVPGAAGAASTLTIGTSATLTASVFPGVLFAVALSVTIVRRTRGTLVAVLMLALFHGACGPSTPNPPTSTSTTTSTSSGTPAGTYVVTITATAGSLRHSVTLTLRVQ